ncbi:MAG: protein kinase [Acidobacteriota bacterium]
MPRIDPTIDFDPNSPPFDQFKGIQLLAHDRRGHVSFETARHHLYVGRHKQTQEDVLIKITSRPGLTYQDNLKNEIATLLTINGSMPDSPYFPLIREHGKVRDGRIYIISSFFAEFPLATAIGPERIPGRTVAYLRTALEIAHALEELHGLQIYHVDLNPMNVLLRLARDRPIIRIIDFESSYESARHSADVFYNPPNTPGYSAPEIFHQAPDARSDVFSLGAVLYTMLAGYKWTWGADVAGRVTDDAEIDSDLKDILLKATDSNPDHRYRSMAGFHGDLADHLERIWPGRSVGGSW